MLTTATISEFLQQQAIDLGFDLKAGFGDRKLAKPRDPSKGPTLFGGGRQVGTFGRRN